MENRKIKGSPPTLPGSQQLGHSSPDLPTILLPLLLQKWNFETYNTGLLSLLDPEEGPSLLQLIDNLPERRLARLAHEILRIIRTIKNQFGKDVFDKVKYPNEGAAAPAKKPKRSKYYERLPKIEDLFERVRTSFIADEGEMFFVFIKTFVASLHKDLEYCLSNEHIPDENVQHLAHFLLTTVLGALWAAGSRLLTTKFSHVLREHVSELVLFAVCGDLPECLDLQGNDILETLLASGCLDDHISNDSSNSTQHSNAALLMEYISAVRGASHIATRFEREKERLRILSTHIADIDSIDPASGCTALHRACDYLEFDLVEILLEYGADPNFGDGNQRTALHHCVMVVADDKSKEEEAIRIIRLLVSKSKADLDACDIQGETPAFHACRLESLEVLRELLSLGVKVNCVNKNNVSLLEAFIQGAATLQDFVLFTEKAFNRVTLKRKLPTVLHERVISGIKLLFASGAELPSDWMRRYSQLDFCEHVMRLLCVLYEEQTHHVTQLFLTHEASVFKALPWELNDVIAGFVIGEAKREISEFLAKGEADGKRACKLLVHEGSVYALDESASD
eukprot:Colp12_sorted_trinity150504_noHs@24055